ncbi:MarR family winged helix-turn-helix transcriptional regulator [Sphingobium yanoikuyae]|uniref:MarR family winged helix-turn-helix transcriptional regulator n=1 Tax=Sphingobium yanoikuyae TaxID=13690 RepID=UPI0022DD27C8|nr:hypothetical protein [Sphingobium yanoikuyae]WBQ19287.1 hypothetical protein PAE53_23110 [Sphingobium yanoikuyae]
MTSPPEKMALAWEEIGLIYEGLAFASRPLRALTHDINERHDLGPRGSWILLMISSGTLHPLDIAATLQIGRSLVTAELVRLEKAGLLVMRKAARDQRRTELTLSAQGQEICTHLRLAMAGMIQERWARYSPQEIRLCIKMLQDIRREPRL